MNNTSSSNNNSNPHTPLYERLVSEEVKELKEYIRLVEHQSHRLISLEKIHDDLEHRLEQEHAARQRLELSLSKRELGWKRQLESMEGEKKTAERLVKEEKVKVDKLMEMVNRMQTEIHTLIKNKFSQGGGGGGHAHGHSHGGHHHFNQHQHYNQNNQNGGGNHHFMGNNGTTLPSSHSYSGNIKRVSSAAAAPSSTTTMTANGGDKQQQQRSTTNSPTTDHHYNNTGTGGTTTNNRRDYSNGSHNSSSSQQHHRNGNGMMNNGNGSRHDVGPHEILAHNGSAEAVRERNAFGSLLDFFGM